MFRNLTFAGISMRERSHRRVLVLVTYLLVAGLFASIGFIRIHWLLPFTALTATVWWAAPLVIFGRVVTPYFGMAPMVGPPNWKPPQRVIRGLGLAATVPPEEDPPDERDIAVRNSAYFTAYWVLGVYCFLVVLVLQPMMDSAFRYRKNLFLIALEMFITLVVSLPQAVVLWSEADLRDEPA